jgi:DNA-binding protein Fis
MQFKCCGCHASGRWPETVSRSTRAVAKKTRGKSPAKKHVPARNGATVVRVKNRPLRDLTEEALQCYFTELNGHRPGDLYELVLGEIETPLFKTVLDYTGGNQSVAVEILSTGGTARALREAGLPVTDVSRVTGFPEIMDGRVKTLHPKIHGGLLGRLGIDETVMREHDIEAIDLWWSTCIPSRPPSRSRIAITTMRHREHRHRRPGNAARGGEEPRACDRGGRSGRLRRSARAALEGRRHHAGAASAPGAATYAHTARYDGQVAEYSARAADPKRRRLPAHAAPVAAPRRGVALRREPASGRRAVPRRSAAAGERGAARVLQGKDAVFQQSGRCGRGARMRAPVRPSRPA